MKKIAAWKRKWTLERAKNCFRGHDIPDLKLSDIRTAEHHDYHLPKCKCVFKYHYTGKLAEPPY